MQDSPADDTDAQHARTDRTTDADRTAIVVARDADERPDTEEIERLAAAADYAVVDALTQRREADGQYNVGRGKAEELARRVAETGVDATLFDVELMPGQYSSLTALLPDGTRIIDRHRLVLDIFEAGAGGKAARLQVELAKLRYDLPRVRETEERTHMQRAAETGSQLVDIESRIRTVESKLARLTDRASERRAERREAGFDLVAIAGYTNAGKSTLLHRLVDDLSISEMAPDHADLDGVAEVEDRLFKTLETTTRRATIDGRRVLLTDTVGLVDGIPHDLVASFSATLDSVADSDVALLVVDASDPRSEMRKKLRVSLAELDDPRGNLLVVLNKADLVAGDLDARREAVRDEVGDDADSVVAVSALEGEKIERLRSTVVDALPDDEAQFDLPNTGETQSFLAWAHEHGRVCVEYAGDRVHVTFSARPAVVEQARSRAATIETTTSDARQTNRCETPQSSADFFSLPTKDPVCASSRPQARLGGAAAHARGAKSMTDNGGNDRRRNIEGRINTLGAGGNSLSGRGNRGRHSSRDASAETETDEEGISSGLGDDGDDEESADASSAGANVEAITEDADDVESEIEEADSDDEADADADEADAEDGEDEPFETRATDVDERSSLEIEMDRFVRAFAARRAEKVGEDSLDEYIVGSVKGYLAGLLGGDVESPGTLKREIEVEADDIFGGLLDTVADDDEDRDDVVIEAVAETYDVPEDDSLVVAGLRDHEALLNGVVANTSNSLDDVSEVVQAAVETRLIEERAD